MKNEMLELVEDIANIGTLKYQGIAYGWWNQDEKHTMRSLSRSQRRAEHNRRLKAGTLKFNAERVEKYRKLLAGIRAKSQADIAASGLGRLAAAYGC